MCMGLAHVQWSPNATASPPLARGGRGVRLCIPHSPNTGNTRQSQSIHNASHARPNVAQNTGSRSFWSTQSQRYSKPGRVGGPTMTKDQKPLEKVRQEIQHRC